MFKSSSRNSRPRGIKVKHILQICLLLAVCLWLIYQVKHSHDKKKEFDEKDLSTKSIDELGNFGRKDLRYRPKEVTKNEKHEEDEEETTGREVEDKHEEDEQVEDKHEEDEQVEDKHEEDEQELEHQHEEENKHEETEDEERGGGDNEIDENDNKKSDGEADRDEEFVDEVREREEDDERESEEKQILGENENSSEEQDQDGDDQNTHGAREEHYIGDDASSEVTHDAESFISEGVRLSLGNSTEQSEANILEQENKSNSTSENDTDDKNSVPQVGEVEMAKNGTSVIVNSVEHERADGSSNTMDSSVTNSTLTTQYDVHHEESSNSTLGSLKASNTSSEERRDVKEMSLGTFGSPESNGTVTLSDSQNMKVDSPNAENTTNVETLEREQISNTSTISESNQSEVNSTVLMEQGNVDAVAGESSTSYNNSEPVLPAKTTTETEDRSGSSEKKESTDATKDEKSETRSESEGTDESSEVSSSDETMDVVQHDPIDSSDSHIGLDEKEVRTDLDTLPDIRTEGDNNEETAAE